MTLDISPETQARLIAKAQEQGLSVDALLERLINDSGPLKTLATNREIRELPVWDLGVRGSLHRRDIYDDER